MPIISKETWDNLIPEEEKQKIRKIYESTKKEEHRSGPERNAVLSLMVDRYEDLFGKENLQPKPLTYEDVARELFDSGIDEKQQYALIPYLGDNDKWRKKLEAIGKLLVVAKFLNKDWKPGERDEKLWTIGIEKYNKTILPVEVDAYDRRTEIVYFRTRQLTHQAIQILGEDTVRLALSNDF